MQKKKYKEIYIDADGESGMAGGAWSICFVYSNQGNFILKGYLRECREFLSKAKRDRGLKYIVCQSLYHRGRSRDIWDCSDERVHIWGPSPKYLNYNKSSWGKGESKWRIIIRDDKGWDADKVKEFKIKRIPKKWVPELFDYKTITEQNG